MKFFRHNIKAKPSPKAPKGKRLYAIGDVHGCKRQLVELMEKIKEDDNSKPSKKTSIVFLGDLIDRGPDSAGVVEWVQSFSKSNASCYALMGNHEDIFLKAHKGDLDALEQWISYGGYQTLESYGLDHSLLNENDLDQIHISMKKNIPQSHIGFLSGCLDSVEFGDYFLVHAGIDPTVPINQQSRDAFLWMREPFLSYPKPMEKVIVHGHTIESQVTQYQHRISVDTGAYNGGPLSAICLENDTVDVFSSL